MEIEEKSSYRQIMKATSLFGGVQFFNIIIQIIRSKVIAVLLGPAGMGIAGLLTATTGLITNLTNLGLGTSAVKNVSIANATGDENKVAATVTVLRRWVWITGMLGLIITLLMSPWLSQITFGNHNYTLAFVWLSVTLLFSQITSGQLVVLQGLRKLQFLAKANLFGSSIGLIITIPFYYFFRLKGIVPAIIISGLIATLLSWYFANKVKVRSVKVTRQLFFQEGKDMLRMGFMLSLSGLITLGASYLVRIYISHTGGVDQVGLYNAGFAIINSYVGLVFTAMATDYYPRLASVAFDKIKANQLINQQAEIAILILAPILTVFLIFINWVVVLLYSSKFIAVNSMIHWAALGMYFKAASWSVAFIFLARGDAKQFFWNEFLANIYVLVLNILGYKYWGITGLGISFLVAYIIYLIQVSVISKLKYKFVFQTTFLKISCVQLILGFLCFLLTKFISIHLTYILGLIFCFFSGWYSIKELNKRIELKSLILNYRKKNQ